MSAPCPSFSTLVVLLPAICILPYFIRNRLQLAQEAKRFNSFNMFLSYGIIRGISPFSLFLAIYYIFYWWGIDSLETILIFAVVSSLLIIHAFARILQAWVGIIYLASNLALSIPDKVRKNFHYVEIGISFIVFLLSVVGAVAVNRHLYYEELIEASKPGSQQAEDYEALEHLWDEYLVAVNTVNIFVISVLFLFCAGVALHYTRRALPIIESLSIDPSKKRHHRFTFYYLILAAFIFILRAGRIIYVFLAFPFPNVGHVVGAERFAIDPETIPSENYSELVAFNFPWSFWTDIVLCFSLYNILTTTIQNHPKVQKVSLNRSGSSLLNMALVGADNFDDDDDTSHSGSSHSLHT